VRRTFDPTSGLAASIAASHEYRSSLTRQPCGYLCALACYVNLPLPQRASGSGAHTDKTVCRGTLELEDRAICNAPGELANQQLPVQRPPIFPIPAAPSRTDDRTAPEAIAGSLILSGHKKPTASSAKNYIEAMLKLYIFMT